MEGVNSELLNKTADRIEAIPAAYDQGTYIKETDASPCGTAACLAGEIIICSEPTVEEGIKKLRRLASDGMPCCAAAALSGLPQVLAHDIFGSTSHHWPEPFKTQYRNADSNTERAVAAAALLRSLISDNVTAKT